MRRSEMADRVGLNMKDPVLRSPPARPRPRRNGAALRPTSVATMIGQDDARLKMQIRIRGSRLRGTHPGHMLLSGGPGLGKTSLAELVAAETGGRLVRAAGTQLTTPQLLVDVISGPDGLRRDFVDVLFIDEVHALPKRLEEMLYMAMEDQRMEVAVGRGQESRAVSIDLPDFVLVAATTLPGNLAQPFRDRFKLKVDLDFYSPEDLTAIISGAAAAKGAAIEPAAAELLGHRSRGTPRIAIDLFEACWDFTLAMAQRSDALITVQSVRTALDLEGIDERGLTKADQLMLRTLCETYKGGPVGKENLSASTGIDEKTLTEVIEPWLLRDGLIRRLRRGRVATKAAFDHLDLECPIGLDDTSQHSDAGWEER